LSKREIFQSTILGGRCRNFFVFKEKSLGSEGSFCEIQAKSRIKIRRQSPTNKKEHPSEKGGNINENY
jgi:hypothetical protein